MSRRGRVVVVGDVVVDRDLVGRVERLCPDAPVPVVDVDSESAGPGGAGLSALLCVQPGVEVTLVAPFADDAPARLLRDAFEQAGVRVLGLAQDGATRCKTRVRSGGQSLLRVDEGGPARPLGPLPAEAVRALESADVVLVSCYGAGMSAHEQLREVLTARAGHHPVVWDPHPRGPRPIPGCALVTPNLDEARAAAGLPTAPPDEVARELVRLWSAKAVCVTTGATGAWLATTAGEPVYAPTTAVDGDVCGAGDAFVAAAVTALAGASTTSEAVSAAVLQARGWVQAGGTSGFRERRARHDDRTPVSHPDGSAAGSAGRSTGRSAAFSRAASAGAGQPESAMDLVRRVRAEGGTVVATGGCYDILHAGHVSCLEAARRLGDALVVLINSDDSVRRLKGEGRPAQPAEDRATVLRGLACVDAVVVFDEDSPAEALDALRPDLWVKGGDYEGADLPEAAQVRSWGGRVVLVPYLSGHSTTAILAAAP
ncbi:PfkB family carbohydrate kinase [Pedococcus sp. 5OH_020]|uniref:PfkB family carbohydrate kinase n=1 Tax=Pedococcus sp. 5OH_020 TaxID=2989814 RepID=UPI0022E9EE88|nr:PfkB family carbohydrate kinase [Pedococcus sp. 5OH_020]